MAESESDIRITTDTPYLALTGELWGVYCEDFGENWPRYNGTTLYTPKIPYNTMHTLSLYMITPKDTLHYNLCQTSARDLGYRPMGSNWLSEYQHCMNTNKEGCTSDHIYKKLSSVD